MAENYQRMLEQILEREKGNRPRLLLHCCCAPCSSYVLEYLDPCFSIDLHFYNPNIHPAAEYTRRFEELRRLSHALNREGEIVEEPYEPREFYEAVKGLEAAPEGGGRCLRCYELRLRKAAAYAAAHGYDYYTTTLTISPHKKAPALNEIGQRLGGEYAVAWLPGDFKKKDGYKRSLELSAQYGLYRQDYCGCAFSRAAREREKTQADAK